MPQTKKDGVKKMRHCTEIYDFLEWKMLPESMYTPTKVQHCETIEAADCGGRVETKKLDDSRQRKGGWLIEHTKESHIEKLFVVRRKLQKREGDKQQYVAIRRRLKTYS